MSDGIKSSDYIKPDNWLVRFIGRPVFKVVINEHNLADYHDDDSQLSRDLENIQASPSFMFAKMPTSALECVAELERRGFRLVDTLVTFEKKIEADRLPLGKCAVRPAEPEDRDRIYEMGGSCFRYTRFHIDPQISLETANNIKSEWVANFFTGKRGDAMFVAEVDGRIAGFVLLIVAPGGRLVIDEIAVDADARRLGIATDLMIYSEKQYSNMNTFAAGTQVANIPSTRCYQRNGFFIAASEYVLHYHNK